ncbi:LLM class flavin-dependent oxidoreductase [Pseudonocardia sp. GCM10023141]|uniref:LLM class flavin-dependent oxidoreductase n=1 Tax=Pseudonocardia sp. GCM10023141 TaxID=3252653 RepID=UPI003612226F
MRFGVFLLSPQFPGATHTAVLDATVATAVAADEAGFDEVWVAEHHFLSYGVCPSALTLAGFLLGATKRVTVGTAVTVLPHHHPVAVAEQVLLAALGEQAVAGFPDLAVVPQPRTRPRPGVVVAATSDATVALAARRGLPLLLGMHADDAEKAAAIAHHESVAGHPVGGHVGVGIAHVADTDAEAVALLQDRLPRWLRPGPAGYRRADRAPHRTRDPDAYAALLCRLHPVGSPEPCRQRLAGVAAGIDTIVLTVDGTGEHSHTWTRSRGWAPRSGRRCADLTSSQLQW